MESAIYFNLGSDIIKENCNFAYYFNKTNIKPMVLDGRNKIVLANLLDDKHIVCNEIPVKIPSFPYVLVNRSVLGNGRIEAINNFLLESLAACNIAESKLVKNFMVNTAFVNYLDNLTETLQFPILLNWTTHEQTLLISLQSSDFNTDLLKAPKTLKDFVHQFWHKKEIFDLQERHYNGLDLADKNSHFNNYTIDIFLLLLL